MKVIAVNKNSENIIEAINETVTFIRQGQTGYTGATLNKTFRLLEALAQSLPQGKIAELAPILAVMHDAQQRKDMVYIADILQYEIVKIITV
tara:strand:- start:8233 stop:8508 length:276 start_codon:yes stop_codon:yes gene_type:complete